MKNFKAFIKQSIRFSIILCLTFVVYLPIIYFFTKNPDIAATLIILIIGFAFGYFYIPFFEKLHDEYLNIREKEKLGIFQSLKLAIKRQFCRHLSDESNN